MSEVEKEKVHVVMLVGVDGFGRGKQVMMEKGRAEALAAKNFVAYVKPTEETEEADGAAEAAAKAEADKKAAEVKAKADTRKAAS